MAEEIESRLGRISRVTREELVVLSRDAPLDLTTVQAAWPDFEAILGSLKGRKMMGVIFNRDDVYRLATSKLDDDGAAGYGLEETVVPGGDYLRLRLHGDPPEIYARIGAAFDELFEHAV